jgi:hypothetical protein
MAISSNPVVDNRLETVRRRSLRLRSDAPASEASSLRADALQRQSRYPVMAHDLTPFRPRVGPRKHESPEAEGPRASARSATTLSAWLCRSGLLPTPLPSHALGASSLRGVQGAQGQDAHRFPSPVVDGIIPDPFPMSTGISSPSALGARRSLASIIRGPIPASSDGVGPGGVPPRGRGSRLAALVSPSPRFRNPHSTFRIWSPTVPSCS